MFRQEKYICLSISAHATVLTGAGVSMIQISRHIAERTEDPQIWTSSARTTLTTNWLPCPKVLVLSESTPRTLLLLFPFLFIFLITACC
jgi:hypothetical protein